MVALTTTDEPRTRRWRSRAFLQPLLITIVGVGWERSFSQACSRAVVPTRFALNLAGAALIGFFVLIPVALGFGVGRLARPSSKDQPSDTLLD